MAQVHQSVATLRIMGDDLDPTEITKALGCEPTEGQRKGDVLVGRDTGIERIAKFGKWHLDASDQEPEDLDGQISELLRRLTPSLDVWKFLGTRYRIDLFCGLFMQQTNEGLVLSPESLKALGERGIELGLDIYSPTREDFERFGGA